ncbi:SPOR domain-containing protein [Paramagnetospirillum caucaseum]|uniref:SPOR domain-containing protein n=1 Tax=Paramagnetospirillum caucaseum TaxID=1244869 RepID=UPI00034DD41B|nr:SPOR domain-containing protein [Paramagnetospirillum caucaseum]
MNGLLRGVLAVSLAAALAGCGVLNDPRGFTDAVMKSPLLEDDSSERAMTALTRGEYSTAERLAIGALRRNPKDPYALYTAGMVYQATGRYDLARQYYEVIIANRPQVTLTTPSQGGPQVRSLVDVAQANLLVVDKMLGRPVAGSALRSGRGPDATPQQYEPMTPQGASRGMVAAEPLGEPGQGSPASMMATRGATQAETNVATRFRALRRLLDEGLVTPDEHSRRRNTNLGALLPYSSKLPPAQGLERPGPTEEQVVDRLRALGVALESRALSPAEHGAERLAILDALLPAEPRKVDLPVLPPRDVMEAASAVGRVERLRAANLVSADEAKREKAAVEKVLDTQLAKQPVSGTATGLRQGTANGAAAKASGGGTPGAGLGSAKTEAEARDTWARIKAKFPEELGGIEATFPRIEQGERGTRWRIVAGPMKSRADATKLCKVLKLHRQSCEATSY